MHWSNDTGNTPLIALPCDTARLLGKWEGRNPSGSVKDRVALAMVADAEEKGLLGPGSTIIEPTSGNTGIALAAIAARRGYRCCIIMPENMSRERQLLMKAYGAQVVLSPRETGMGGAVALAAELAARTEKAFIPGQFDNPANPQAHYDTTGPEIWRDTAGQVEVFVAGVGTGGTVTGAGHYLKEKKSTVQIVAVEPEPGEIIPGLGAGFVPHILDKQIIDEVVAVTARDARAAAREMGRKQGILVGISSGAAIHAAKILAVRPENAGKTIVALLPDSGERYLSTGLYG